jgi:NDP-sugar pyrophosphorylase family protein
MSDIPVSHLSTAILVGGLGTRLRPVVSDRPKALARIRGRPFLCYLLDTLCNFGVREAILCTGYQAEAIQDTFGAFYRDLHLIYSQESEPRGTGGALRLALPFMRCDSAIVLNGDSYCRADLAAFVRFYRERRAQAALVLVEAPDVQRFGQVSVDAEGRLLRFEEKGNSSGPGWINAGIYLLSQEVLRSIPREQPVSLEREVFPRWLGRGLLGFRQPGRFLDIGTPDSYREAESFFACGE